MKNLILPTIIKGLIVISFFTPLVVSSLFIFPFVFPKTAAFQVVVEIMLVFWLALIIYRPEYRPNRSKILWALGIFLFIVFLASLFGVNFQLSFWSSYERMTGIITMFHYFTYFVILSSVLKTKKDWLIIFDFFIAASLSLGFYALGQKLNVAGFLIAGPGRVSATFGNPAYFAAYLIFALFFCTFMFFQRRGKGVRIYYALAFLFNFLILYWTETRGALLAFAAALFLFLPALIFWPKEGQESEAILNFRRRLKKVSLAILIFLIIFIPVAYLSRDAGWVKKSKTLHRLTSISLRETTTQTRLLAWGASWKGFLEKPVLGWGWENYNVVFNKFYNPNLFPVENWFDRSHNIVFDTLVTTGGLGFLAYLGIFAAVFWTLWHAFRQKKIDFLNGALIAILFIAYFLQNLFIFDMLYSYLPLFTVLAFISWIGKNDNPVVSEKKQALAKPNIFLNFVFAVIFVFVIYFINIKPALAGYYGIVALQSQRQGIAQVVDNFKKSLSYGTFGRFESRLQLFETAKNVIRNYDKISDKKASDDLINLALAEGEKAALERPTDARYLLSIGELDELAARFDGTRLNRAAEILQQAYELSPTHQIIFFAAGEVKIKQGKTQEGISDFQQAIALNPSVRVPYVDLALIYFALGDQANGEKEVIEIGERFGQNSFGVDEYQKIAVYSGMNKNYETAIKYLLKAIEIQPTNADLYASLAANYAQIGEKAKAKEAALKSVELDPAMKDEAEQFIKSLGI